VAERKSIEFLRKYWFIILMALFSLLGILLLITYWAEPQKSQTVAAFLSFIATAILLSVTWLYVRTTQAQLNLMREQWEEGRKPRITFSPHVDRETYNELEYGSPPNQRRILFQIVYLEIWNLGQPTINILGVRFTQNLTGRTRAIETHEIVRKGDVGRVNITEPLLKILSHSNDFIEIVNAPPVMRQIEMRVKYSFGLGNKISRAETFEFAPSLEGDRVVIVVAEPAIHIEE
jgi:hypothetical protein